MNKDRCFALYVLGSYIGVIALVVGAVEIVKSSYSLNPPSIVMLYGFPFTAFLLATSMAYRRAAEPDGTTAKDNSRSNFWEVLIAGFVSTLAAALDMKYVFP